MRQVSLLVLTAATIFVSAMASGQERRDQRRQERQRHRIDQGSASSQLNEAERRRLEQGQRRVENTQTRAERDGYVDPAEAQRLEQLQDRQSERIRTQRHDSQTGSTGSQTPQ